MTKPNVDRAVQEIADLVGLSVYLELWMEGHHDLEQILTWATSKNIDHQEIASDVLTYGEISPLSNSWFSANNDPTSFETKKARRALKAFAVLLENPVSRTAALSYLWAQVLETNTLWTEKFVQSLPSQACAHLLLSLPSPEVLRAPKYRFNASAARYVPDAYKADITETARQIKKIPQLYALTGWPECHALSTAKEQDAMLEIDLGI
jgi:hypothetical protein